MLGAIIGDIAGSRYEFRPTNDYNFEMFGEQNDFTDDTICTVAIADAILKECDYGDSLHRWCRKYPYPKGGYGGRFKQWVNSGSPQPYGSFGNGSAMRVSAIGWWFDNTDDIIREARKSAECTHNHKYGIEGAQAVALAIADCRKLRALHMGQTLSHSEILTKGLASALRYYISDPHDFNLDLSSYRNIFDETCQGTVPVAFAIILESTSFEDAVRRAVSLGADADTLGAITGCIAEALWDVPTWMQQKALSYLPQEMADVLSQFTNSLHGTKASEDAK